MSTIVTLPYNPVWEPVEWAKKNCPSYITNDVHRYINADGFKIGDVDRVDYFFGDEKEAMLFRIRWASLEWA